MLSWGLTALTKLQSINIGEEKGGRQVSQIRRGREWDVNSGIDGDMEGLRDEMVFDDRCVISVNSGCRVIKSVSGGLVKCLTETTRPILGQAE